MIVLCTLLIFSCWRLVLKQTASSVVFCCWMAISIHVKKKMGSAYMGHVIDPDAIDPAGYEKNSKLFIASIALHIVIAFFF